jgi:2-amino-4-hydroxy-6-hydroxymethyldihydropteridine diphosphokinase
MIELAVLGFGSNLGRRFSNVRNAVKLVSLSPNFNLLGVSSVYETQPWGLRRQPKFINCAMAGFYRGDVGGLLYEIESIERQMGRRKIEKWRPRIIDIDILFFGERIIRQRRITVPHQFLHERNFVLKPLMDLIPDFKHPVLKKTIRYLFKHSQDKSRVSFVAAGL